MSLDPAPALLWTTERPTVGSLCDSRAKYFFKLSTHTIVYLQSGVHNKDILASVACFFQREVATGVSVH